MDIYFSENKNEIVQSLYYSKCELKKCLGFCKYHQAYVTVNQLKQKECLAKECPHLVKTEHEFWVERDEKLKRKKEKKNLKKIIEQQDEQKKIKKKKYVCIEITTKEKNGLRKGALRGLKSEIVKIDEGALDEKTHLLFLIQQKSRQSTKCNHEYRAYFELACSDESH